MCIRILKVANDITGSWPKLELAEAAKTDIEEGTARRRCSSLKTIVTRRVNIL